MVNIETTGRFSGLKSIFNNEDNYSFTLLIYLFQKPFYNYNGKLSSFIVKKMFVEILKSLNFWKVFSIYLFSDLFLRL